MVDFGVHHLPLPGGAPAPKNRGSLSPPSPPPLRRHDAPCEAGTPWRGAALGFTPKDSGNPCQPASNAGFPGTTLTTTARAAPSDSADL